jgi:hypothetical protein
VAGVSAAIAPAAIPMVNKAEAINVFMGSPAVGINERLKEYAGSVKFNRDEDHFTKCGRESCAEWTRPNTGTPRSPY